MSLKSIYTETQNPMQATCKYSYAVNTCFLLYIPSRIASKCSLEYTEPQGLEGLFTTIALVRSSIRDSSWSRSTSQDLSG